MRKVEFTSLGVLAMTLVVDCLSSANAAIILSGPQFEPRFLPASVYSGPAMLRVDELIDVNPDSRDVFTFDLRKRVGGSSPGLSVERREDGTVRVFGQAYGGLQGRSGAENPNYSGVWNIDVIYDASHNVVQDLFFLTTPEIRSLRSPFMAATTFGERTLLWGYGQGDILAAMADDGFAEPSSGPVNLDLDAKWLEQPFDGSSLFLPGLGPDLVFSSEIPSTTPGVPEPVEWLLASLALGGLAVAYRRKTRQALS